jgi:hypothetical protein
MTLAPIVMFTYNRLEHTKQTLQALASNTLSQESLITIYSDAPKSAQDVQSVSEVRDYLDTVSGFKSVRIIRQSENQGLAKSIINGVSQSVKEHGRTIVIEDDMLTSPYFLKYMNEALDFYEREKKVMHVTGWSYPISGEGLDDGFLWRGMNCWGWATWEDRWAYFRKDIPTLYKQVPVFKRRQFNLSGRRRYWAEVAANRSGLFDTWAVFWYATIYLRSGLCVNPTESLIQNIGLDGTGVNCTANGLEHLVGGLSQKSEFNLQSIIEENPIAFKRILDFYDQTRKPLIRRVWGRLKRMFE